MRPLTAPVFDVQRFSLHDGPGIRSLVFFKGCNLACAWCQNPESQQVSPVISFQATRCRDLFACADVCPSEAISREGFRIIADRCTLCMKCVDACPSGAINLIGDQVSPDDLFETLLADEAYYESSGGGVTFSGGEPTLHPKFMDALLDLCNARGIHTAMETCGSFSLKLWRSILPKLQLIYFDLKVMDCEGHRIATGVGNERILENAKHLIEKGYPVEFRVTLVPGYTDTRENLSAIEKFLTAHGQNRVHLLSYHRMGEAKIGLINGEQPRLGLESYSEERRAEIAAWFEERGISVPDCD